MKAFVLTAVLTTLLAAQTTLAQSRISRELEKSCQVEATVAAMRLVLQERIKKDLLISGYALSQGRFEIDHVSGGRVSANVGLSVGDSSGATGDTKSVDVVLKMGKNSCTLISAKFEILPEEQ